jgi:hypothetical protein
VICRCFHVHFGFVVGILRKFEVLVRDGARTAKEPRTIKLGVRQQLVRLRLVIIRERPGDVRALDAHNELPFSHLVSQARVNLRVRAPLVGDSDSDIGIGGSRATFKPKIGSVEPFATASR